MAMCEMRGMYNYENVPPSAKILQPQDNGCAWAGPSHSTIGCARVFYTPGCLLSCDDRHLRRAGRAARALDESAVGDVTLGTRQRQHRLGRPFSKDSEGHPGPPPGS